MSGNRRKIHDERLHAKAMASLLCLLPKEGKMKVP